MPPSVIPMSFFLPNKCSKDKEKGARSRTDCPDHDITGIRILFNGGGKFHGISGGVKKLIAPEFLGSDLSPIISDLDIDICLLSGKRLISQLMIQLAILWDLYQKVLCHILYGKLRNSTASISRIQRRLIRDVLNALITGYAPIM